MFERIRGYYNKGLWTAAMVRQAVDKGILSEEQYQQIVGLPPDTDNEEEGLQIAESQPDAGEEEAGNQDQLMEEQDLPPEEPPPMEPPTEEPPSDTAGEEVTDDGLLTGELHPQIAEPQADNDGEEAAGNG